MEDKIAEKKAAINSLFGILVKNKEKTPGEKLKIIMSILEIQSKDLATISGVSESTISRIISGKIEGKASTWKKIADSLNMSMDFFFNK